MSNERPIWRPNDVPLKEWEAMSKEDQIRWWKDHQSPPPPKPHMKTAIRFYNRGEITVHEFCVIVAKIATPKEIEGFVRECPLELMAALKEDLSQYGPDESKWPQTFSMRSYYPWVTAEEIEESQRREQERIWNGVRLLKKHLP